MNFKKISNSQFNDDPNYMFRASQAMAEVAIEMTKKDLTVLFRVRKHILIGHICDALDKKTLGLLIFHPAM